MTGSTLNVRVARKAVEAVDICAIELVSVDGTPLPAFSAGSHIDVHLPGDITRQYSLCNDPTESHRYLIGVSRYTRRIQGSARAGARRRRPPDRRAEESLSTRSRSKEEPSARRRNRRVRADRQWGWAFVNASLNGPKLFGDESYNEALQTIAAGWCGTEAWRRTQRSSSRCSRCRICGWRDGNCWRPRDECVRSVKRHQELTPWRHRELTPGC